MGNIGTFGSFTQARLGIYAAMKGLTVTGNNISNINTTGYTRQVLDQVSLRTGGADRYQSKYGVRIGNGALVTGLSQIRDPYLDIRYRTEMSSVGAMDTKLGGLNNIADILDEVGSGDNENGIIVDQMNKLMDSIIQLSDKAGQRGDETIVRTNAETLCTLFNTYADKLATLKTNAESALKKDISEVNNILTSIRELNSSIRKSEIHGDEALELRDERNRLIDSLSEYMKINVTYSLEDIGAGTKVEKLTITLGDANPDPNSPTDRTTGIPSDETVLVDGVYCAQITSTGPAAANGDLNFDKNYNLTVTRLEDVKGRVKQVKDPNGAYVPSTAVDLDDNDLFGALQSTRELLTESGEFATPDTIADIDESAATKRGIPYYQKSLDLLAQKFAEEMNNLNKQYAVDENGNYLGNGGPADDLTNNPIPADHPLTEDELARLENEGVLKSLFSSSGDSDDMTGITAANISVSKSWAKGDVHVLLSRRDTIEGMEAIAKALATNDPLPPEYELDQSTMNSNVDRMITLIDKKLTYNPQELNEYAGAAGAGDKPASTYLTEGSFQEMLDNMCTVLGKDQRSTNIQLNTYYNNAVELDSSRDAVSGVDLNDEAMNMMQYQKAYSAACRLMTAIDEALERLINNTGIAGR